MLNEIDKNIKNITLSKILLNETCLIYEAKIDRMIYKIKDSYIREKFQDIAILAKQVFSGRMDYVNWFFDHEVVIPDGKSDFDRFKNSWKGFKNLYPYSLTLINFFYLAVEGESTIDAYYERDILSGAVSEDIAYIILSYFNIPEKMCEELNKCFTEKKESPLSWSDRAIREILPEIIKKSVRIAYWGGHTNLLEKLQMIKHYYSFDIPAINNFNVMNADGAVELISTFSKIHEEWEEKKRRLITIEERPQENENLLLVCKSNPDFEWYSFDVGNNLEVRSLRTCAANSASDEMWALREKQYNEGELIGHISRFHIGFDRTDKALRELKAYKNNKLSPKYFPYFADLAISGLFDKIEILKSHKPENDLQWADLPEDMLKNIVSKNPNLLKTDEYLSDRFYDGEDWEMKEYYLDAVNISKERFNGRHLIQMCIFALRGLYDLYSSVDQEDIDFNLEDYKKDIKEAIFKLQNMKKNSNATYEDICGIMKEFESSIIIKEVEK